MFVCLFHQFHWGTGLKSPSHCHLRSQFPDTVLLFNKAVILILLMIGQNVNVGAISQHIEVLKFVFKRELMLIIKNESHIRHLMQHHFQCLPLFDYSRGLSRCQ